MGKSTMATRLPRRLEENMKIVGEQIKLGKELQDIAMINSKRASRK